MADGGVLGIATTASECRTLLAVVWCAFDGFRTTYLGMSAFTSRRVASLIRSNPPTRLTHNIQERFACKSSCNAALEDERYSPDALFPRNLRLDHIAHLFLYIRLLSFPIMQAKRGDRLLSRHTARARLIREAQDTMHRMQCIP